MKNLMSPKDIIKYHFYDANKLNEDDLYYMEQMIIASQRDTLECVAHNVVDTIIEHRQNTNNKTEISAVKINESISNLMPK